MNYENVHNIICARMNETEVSIPLDGTQTQLDEIRVAGLIVNIYLYQEDRNISGYKIDQLRNVINDSSAGIEFYRTYGREREETFTQTDILNRTIYNYAKFLHKKLSVVEELLSIWIDTSIKYPIKCRTDAMDLTETQISDLIHVIEYHYNFVKQYNINLMPVMDEETDNMYLDMVVGEL